MARRKHQRKEVEEVLGKAERAGWRVESPPRRYYRLRCPCEEKHMKWVHLTPSDPNYAKNLLAWLRRASCWREDG